MSKVTIYTDGSCKGNPGPGGWGAALRCKGKEKQIYGGLPMTTNNAMELMAVIKALQLLTRSSDVIVYSDSQYVLTGITDWIHGWKRNGWKNSKKKPVINSDLWKELDAEVAKHDIEWIWVRGHMGDEGNELADDLANMGAEENMV